MTIPGKSSICFLLFLITCMNLSACPTCVGKVTKTSPAFFSDEFYQPYPKHDAHVDLTTTMTQRPVQL